MSVQGDVEAFLTSQKPKRGGAAPITPDQVAEATGHDRPAVNRTLWNLEQRKRVELVRQGRRIVGVKVLDKAPDRRRKEYREAVSAVPVSPVPDVVPKTYQLDGHHNGSEPAQETRRAAISPRVPSTPALDAYEAAKARFAAIQDEFGDLVTASFKENPYAEDGLRLKEFANNILALYASASGQARELMSDNEELRRRHDMQIAAKAVAAGAVAVSGD